jgi:hypothetical protein
MSNESASANQTGFVPETLLAAVDTALKQANQVAGIMQKEVDDYMKQLLEPTRLIDHGSPIAGQPADSRIAPFHAALELSLAAAQDTYTNTLSTDQTASKLNRGPKSRDAFLYFTLKATIAQALGTFYSTRQNSIATACATFWQSVENTLDT